MGAGEGLVWGGARNLCSHDKSLEYSDTDGTVMFLVSQCTFFWGLFSEIMSHQRLPPPNIDFYKKPGKISNDR